MTTREEAIALARETRDSLEDVLVRLDTAVAEVGAKIQALNENLDYQRGQHKFFSEKRSAVSGVRSRLDRLVLELRRPREAFSHLNDEKYLKLYQDMVDEVQQLVACSVES